MRKIKDLIGTSEKVYISLKTPAIRDRFMSDAQREGITFGDGAQPAKRPAEDIMRLLPDGAICFVGFAGRTALRLCCSDAAVIDYEKYVSGSPNYIVSLR